MATISRLSVSLTANTKGLRKGLNAAKRNVKKFTGQIFNLKSAIVGAIGVGSLGALSKSAIGAFAKQEQAVAKLNASIISMKRNTKGLSGNLQKLATQIQNKGVIGDEAILEGASFLTTYRDISDKLLPRTIRVMADLAAKMGGDTTRAANLLGKASMGMTGSLSLAGISLSDATKDSKKFEDILREIEEQVGGTNKALGDTASGGITQFKNAFGDVQEKLGEVLAIAISPFLRSISAKLGDVSFNAKDAGEKFKNWLVESARGLTVLADSIAGIKVAFLNAKLAAAGFALFTVARAKQVADSLNTLPNLVGLNLIDTTQINSDFNSLLTTVKDVKSEISSTLDELGKAPPSIKLKAEIDKFAFDAEVESLKKRIGFVEGGTFRKVPATQKGTLQRLEVNGSGSGKKIDMTNSILEDIRKSLRRDRIAVAG